MRGAALAARVVVAVLLFGALAQAGPPLSDALTGAGKADYDAGKLLFTDGDYEGADIKFRAAYDLSHDARLLWNMAACEKNLRHYALAARLVHEYLDTAGAQLAEDDRKDAQQLLDALQSFVVKLTIVVDQPGADIEVDDVHVGTSPLDKPVILDLGQRKIVVKRSGFKEATKAVTLGATADDKVEITLAPDVHEGSLVVTTAPGARVFLDGKPVGTGGFQGKLKSGGHTLRIEADGMQPFQQEVTIEDDERRAIDVPLTPILSFGPAPPSYKGFYGRFSTPFWFGFGGNYQPPPGLAGTPRDGTMLGFGNLKLALGDSFGWFRVEGIAMAMLGVRLDGGFDDPSGQHIVDVRYPMLSGFFGVGARVTSKHPVFRVTGGFALGGGPHTILDAQVIHYTPCDNGGSSCPPSSGNASSSPGWGSFAMAGDVGITLGSGSPGRRFWVGIDWYVDFPPDIVVGPLTSSGIPAQYLTNGGATAIHGPQFFIGPAIGVDFGH